MMAFLLARPAGLAGSGGGEGLFLLLPLTRFSRLLIMASVLLLVTFTLCTGFSESWTILEAQKSTSKKKKK